MPGKRRTLGDYGGSRSERARYNCKDTSWSGFVEMTPDWSIHVPHDVIRKFRHALLAVPDVTQVDRHPAGTKSFQGDPGDHYQEHNFVVTTKRTEGHYIEFGLTRNDYMKDPDAPFTVTAMFKGGPVRYVEEAWRILRGACYDNCLHPAIVDRDHEEALKKVQDFWEYNYKALRTMRGRRAI